MLRIKELQNQLADAHYRLNELASENKLLKSLQKRQDSALKRYEGTNAELPRIINSHHEELRVLQIKYKKLKTLQKETCNTLKEKENEFQQLQSQNKHLLQLSKDRNLGEREKLQSQVSDLNHTIQQQQDTIQMLHRKLNLETKSLKQQLNLEISKRKEIQKHLDETINKLRKLENLLDNRERRLYYNNQLLFPEKNQRLGTQSLTNLRDISSSNPLKLTVKNKKWQTDIQENSLPMLHISDISDKNTKTDENSELVKTETMSNLEQVRKYRLQKSSHKDMLDGTEQKSKELDFQINETSGTPMVLENMTQLEKQDESVQEHEISADKFRKMYKNRNSQHFNKLLEKELVYSSGGSESENENFKDSYTNATNNSKKLHTRLISSANSKESSDSKELIPFSDFNYRDKLKVLVRERTNSYESDSEVESERRKRSIRHYLMNHENNNTFKSNSPVFDNQANHNSDKEVEKLTSSKNMLNGSQKLYQNLINEMHIQLKNVENESAHAQYDVKTIQKEYNNSEDLENYVFEHSASETEEYSDVNTKKNEHHNISILSKDEHNILHKMDNEEKAIDTKLVVLRRNEIPLTDPEKKSFINDFSNFSQNYDKETTNITETEVTNKNTHLSLPLSLEDYNLETKNELNKQEADKQLESIDVVPYNAKSLENNSLHDNIWTDISITNENSIKTGISNYNKEKLLASMKAIDDNENIEFLNQDYAKHNVTDRRHITDNVFENIPTHVKKKQDVIKDIFDTDL
ncbi:unnamed protein product [Xylocopa violacea]